MKDGKMVRHDEFIYEKSIKALGNNIVWAEVNRLNAATKECLCNITQKGFNGLFVSQETNFKNAHKWADEKIALFEKYESGGEEYYSFKDE